MFQTRQKATFDIGKQCWVALFVSPCQAALVLRRAGAGSQRGARKQVEREQGDALGHSFFWTLWLGSIDPSESDV